MDDLIEKVAEIIYKTQGGSSNEEEFEMMTGNKLRLWRVEGVPWDFHPDVELCEWERDDFRHQAKAVLEFLKSENH